MPAAAGRTAARGAAAAADGPDATLARVNLQRLLALEETIDLCVEMPQVGNRLDSALVALLRFPSRQRVAQWIRAGRVTIDGAPESKPARRLRHGQRLRVAVPKTPRDLGAGWGDLLELPIVHDGGDWIVADKPSGLQCHPAGGVIKRTLLTAMAQRFAARCAQGGPWLPHRLDRDTSGLVVVAFTAAVQARFVRAFQGNTIRRLYRATVCGEMAASRMRIDAPVLAIAGKPARAVIDPAGRPASTRVRVRRVLDGATEVAIEPNTGRQHQIRVHLASIGHPIVGDRLYGAERGLRLALDACALLIPAAVGVGGRPRVVRRHR
jgi:23S rRNA pseudouridine1911/1915/1917 synthase